METKQAKKEQAKSLLAKAKAETLDSINAFSEKSALCANRIESLKANQGFYGVREMFTENLDMERTAKSLQQVKNPMAERLGENLREIASNLAELAELANTLADSISSIGLFTDFLKGKEPDLVLPE